MRRASSFASRPKPRRSRADRGRPGAVRWACAASCLFAAVSSGCAPLGVLRPASGFIEGRTKELGLGAVAVSPRPYVDENWSQAGQLWFSTEALRWLHLSAITAFDDQSLAAGGAVRVMFVRRDRFAAGGELEAGYAWGGVSLPLAARLFDQTWFYVSPRAGNFGIDPMFGLPMGLNLRIQGGLIWRAEYQTSWVNLKAYQHRSHLGTAIVVQW